MIQPYHTDHDMLVVLGPTATGKTKLAVQLAMSFNCEIISADSRQVYLGMDIGTGKDLNEYEINGLQIPYHLIDISNPKEEYNVFQFQQDVQKKILALQKRKKIPLLCGGTGFYIKAILMDFNLPTVKPNKNLRKKLENWTLDKLIKKLESILPDASKHYPLDTKRRIIRSIEVEMSRRKEKDTENRISHNPQSLIQNPIVLGVEYPREIIRERITKRLYDRIDQGMIKEVESLLNNGITHKRLENIGLEYRFISRYLLGQLTQEEMIEKMNIAIHQFAKRQMTIFRNIEKNGIRIHWIHEGNIEKALNVISKRHVILKNK